MKTPEQIKQMAEAKALEKYPVKIVDMDGYRYDQNESSRQIYAQAIIDNYKEKERVNERLEEILYSDKAIEKWFDENIGKDYSASSAIYKFRLDLRKLMFLPASQQQEIQTKEK